MSDPGPPLFRDQSTALLAALLADSHPLMVEAFCVAALPHRFDLPLFSAVRQRDDGRDGGLVERLKPYSFVAPLVDRPAAEPAYAVRGREREALNRRWIDQDGAAYGAAHARALAYFREHPDPNPFAQTQALVYHGLLVEAEFDAAVALLISSFRTYRNERQFAAIERLLAAGGEARSYLALLGSGRVSELEDLLGYLGLRLAQLQGKWDDAGERLEALEGKPGLDKRLAPYILRARGLQAQGQGRYVQAIAIFKDALRHFDAELALLGKVTLFQPENDLRAERAYTQIDLGRAYVDLAHSVRGETERQVPRPGLGQWLRAAFSLLVSLPLILYLTFYLGRAVWHPPLWAALSGLDWIIARLFGAGARWYRRADAGLERYGQPAEATVADAELAELYLALGHAREAERLYRPLAEAGSSGGPYRRAAAQVGLAEASLRQGRPAPAVSALPAALSALEPYGDRDLDTRARALLGEAQLLAGQPEEGIDTLAAACRSYQETESWAQATGLAERLEGWVQSGGVSGDALVRARQVIDGLPQRHYPGRYRHPLLVAWRQLVLTVLPIVLLLAPLLTIQLGTDIGLAPEIHFRPAPIIKPGDIVTLQLSQGVARADLYQVTVSDALLWAAGAGLLAYLLLSFVLGLAAVAFTPLSSVQRRGQGATVRLDDQGIALGSGPAGGSEGQATAGPSRQVAWAAVTSWVRADTRLWRAPLADASAAAVTGEEAPLVIPGSTAWYGSLGDRVRRLLPPSARTTDASYSILRSLLGVLYALNVAFLGVLGLLAALERKDLVFYRAPGSSYSLVDLYPYFYLFLVVAPLWWAVVQPLRRHVLLRPRSRYPLAVLGAGLALVLAAVLLRFRPLLTVLDLYVPLASVILLVSGEVGLWRAREAGRPVHPAWLRVTTAVLAAAGCLLMLTLLWRDVRAYHYLVRGNALRDAAERLQQSQSPEEAGSAYEQAVPSYGLAAEIGSRPVWGIATRLAARIRLGVPPAHSLTWLSALTQQATLEARLGRYLEASRLYSQTLEYTDQPDLVHAWLAIASLGQGTTQFTQQGYEVDPEQYTRAIQELDTAIDLNPHRASYHLWRGLAHHALVRRSDCGAVSPPGGQSEWDAAADGYARALSAGAGSVRLTEPEQERAWTGLGWLHYLCKDYARALDAFQNAVAADERAKAKSAKLGKDYKLSSEAKLGEGYALYALTSYEEALQAWEKARELEPRDPTIVIALATAHWRLGGEAGQALGYDPCTEYQRSADLLEQAVRRDQFFEQLDKDVAVTWRTLGYVQYLVGGACPQPGKVPMYQAAVDSFTQALALDAAPVEYWYRRGRIEYSVADLLHAAGDRGPGIQSWLERAMDDLAQAAVLQPGNPVNRHDRAWIAYLAWRWIEPKTPQTAAWLFQALADLEAALRLNDVDRGTSYRPNFWVDTIEPEAFDGNLKRGDASLNAGDAQTALEYYRLVAGHRPVDPRAAFKAGLASLVLGKPSDALAWYRSGLAAAQAAGQMPLAQQALQELVLRSSTLRLETGPILDLFREKGVVLDAADPAAAFGLGLNALRLRDAEGAQQWALTGLALAQERGDSIAPRQALSELYLALLDDPALPAGDLVALFRAAGVSPEPDTAALAFGLARSALLQGDLSGSAELYNRGIDLATADTAACLAGGKAIEKCMSSVASSAVELRAMLEARPEISPTVAYWPLREDAAAVERQVASLDHPDLFWRLRAEFAFRLLTDYQLMRVQPGGETVAEQIYAGLIGDVERAYALDPALHKKWRDFFVDGNTGWLFLRRADDDAKKGEYALALAGYEEAARRIRPNSQDAALDLTEALFKAGLTALRLGEPERAAGWYDEGAALVEAEGARFGLGKKVQPAVDALNKLLEEQPALVPSARPILEQLNALP